MSGPVGSRPLFGGIFLGFAVGCCVLAVGFGLNSESHFNRWDNDEFFSAVISSSQRLVLSGRLPFWNHHNNLGEPILGYGQAGALYFGYTLSVWIQQGLGLSLSALCTVIFCLHVGLCSAGLAALLVDERIRRSFVIVACASAVGAGYVLVISQVWIFMVAIYAWIPWALFGLVRLLRWKKRSGFLIAALSIAAMGHIGHPQLTLYAWTLIGGFGLLYAWSRRDTRVGLLRTAAVLGVGGLLSAPTLMPIAALLPLGGRRGRLDLATFLEHSVTPGGVLGLFHPLLNVDPGFLVSGQTIALYFGVALPLSIIAVARWPFSWPRNPMCAAVCGMSLLFGLFSLGRWGLVYLALTNVPIWSSMRWPNKFLILESVLLPIVSVLLLESLLGKPRRRQVAVFVTLGVSLCALLGAGPSPMFLTWKGAGFTLTWMCSLVGFWYLDRASGQRLLALSAVVGHGLLFVLSQALPLKTYSPPLSHPIGHPIAFEQRRVPVGTADLGLTQLENTRAMGLFHQAVLNREYSATGHVPPLAIETFRHELQANVAGVMSVDRIAELVTKGRFAPLSIRYLVVARSDELTQQRLEKIPGLKLWRTEISTVTYEYAHALPRVHSADRVLTVESSKPLDANSVARIQGLKESRDMSITEIEDFDFSPGGGVRTVVNVTGEQGFVVFSQLSIPGWSATIDGQRAELQVVNDILQGLFVPFGRHVIQLTYVPLGFKAGCWLALCGTILGLIFLRPGVNESL